MPQTLEQRFDEFVGQSAADMGAAQAAIAALLTSRGVLSSLTTAAKDNLVVAINEIVAALSAEAQSRTSAVAAANTALAGEATTRQQAVTALNQSLANEASARATQLAALKAELMGDGVADAMDTFKELGDLIAQLNANGGNAASAITALANTRVSAEVEQTFTAAQKAQARSNIGAASPADVAAVDAKLGDVSKDFRPGYQAAKAAAVAAAGGVPTPAPVALVDAPTIAWNAADAAKAKAVLGGNRALGPVLNVVEGGTYTLHAVQDATGGRTLDLTQANVIFGDGGSAPVIKAAAGAVTVLAFEAVKIGNDVKLLLLGAKAA